MTAPTTYLVFVRQNGGVPCYLDAKTVAGTTYKYTYNRTEAERFTRAACVERMRVLLKAVVPGDGYVPGFEGA